MHRLPLGSVGNCSFQDLPRRPRCATDKYVCRNEVPETETRQLRPVLSTPQFREKKKNRDGTKDQTPLLSGDPSLLSRKLLDAQRNQAQASLNQSFRDTVRILSVPPCAFSLCLSFPLRNIHTELGPPTTESTQ